MGLAGAAVDESCQCSDFRGTVRVLMRSTIMIQEWTTSWFGLLQLLLLLLIGYSRAQQYQCPYVTGGYGYNGSRAVDLHLSGLEPLSCSNPPAVCLEPNSRYRTFDGSCYNEQHTDWGMAYRRYGRLLSADYGDGYSLPGRAESGNELPNARLLSNVLHKDLDVPDVNLTIVNMFFGQFVSHDNSMLAGTMESLRKVTKCCSPDFKVRAYNDPDRHQQCFEISVAGNDTLYSPHEVECIELYRTISDKDVQCNDRSVFEVAEQLSVVTAWLDLSLVYGNSNEEIGKLRTYEDGLLSTLERDGNYWPLDAESGIDTCANYNEDGACYQLGDKRANQNPGISVLQIVFMREHNRLARGLKLVNPLWSDYRLFHEARRINIATYQNDVYYEWLPLMLGTEQMLAKQLIYTNREGGYVTDYNATVNPAPLAEHSQAALRYFHTQVVGRLHPLNEERDFSVAPTILLSDVFFRSEIIEEDDNYDSLIRCYTTQSQQTTDSHVDPEIRGKLFSFGKEFGVDIVAVDVQRSRDHGLPSYNKYRPLTGLSRVRSWKEYEDVFPPTAIEIMRQVYESWEDVDMTVGGIVEKHVEGTLLGQTFHWIILEQFRRYRHADRFFFENGHDENTRFTEDQLLELRKSTMARRLCDNSNSVVNMQPFAFQQISDENRLQSCDSLPFVDLEAWRDPTAQDDWTENE